MKPLWQQWMEQARTGRWKVYTFPVYMQITDEWMVFEPDSDKSEIVPNKEYLEFYNTYKG